MHTDNHVFPKISAIEAKGKSVVVIKVRESDEKPVFFKGRAYVRLGKSTHKLSASEIRKLAKESGKKVYWDEQICEGATFADIDKETLNKFRKQYEDVNKTAMKSSDKDLLKALNCIKDAGRITNAGILL